MSDDIYVCEDCENEYEMDYNGVCPDCGGWVTGIETEPYDTLEEKWL